MSTGIFLDLGTIKGESTDKNHKDWIELQHVNFGVSNNAHIASSGVRKLNKGTADFRSIHCTKIMDSSTVKLLSAVAKGDFIDKVKLNICTMFNDELHPYAELEMDQCMISAITENAAKDGGYPQEDFTIVFSKVKWTFTPLNSDGKKGSKVGPEGWDLLQNTKQ